MEILIYVRKHVIIYVCMYVCMYKDWTMTLKHWLI